MEDRAEYIATAVRLEYCPQWGEDAWSWTLRSDYRERIVRCRDCKYYNREWDLDDEPLSCELWHWGDGSRLVPKPDGFCAWGEPRK